MKHVPRNRVVAQFEGTWKGQIRYKHVNLSLLSSVYGYSGSTASLAPPTASSSSLASKHSQSSTGGDWHPLIDLSELRVVPMGVRSMQKQLPNESRKLWENVTSHLLNKNYSDATKAKQQIEQRQRDEAEARKRKGEE